MPTKVTLEEKKTDNKSVNKKVNHVMVMMKNTLHHIQKSYILTSTSISFINNNIIEIDTIHYIIWYCSGTDILVVILV